MKLAGDIPNDSPMGNSDGKAMGSHMVHIKSYKIICRCWKFGWNDWSLEGHRECGFSGNDCLAVPSG